MSQTRKPASLDVMNENTSTPVTKLVRSRDDRMIAGVCGGAATLFGIDPAILRIALVAATVLGFGSGALLYLICWIILPEEA
jgi:phage shock protein C